MQHKDLQHTAHACFGLSICQETVQQVRGILKERSRRVSSSLGDAYPDQRQVLPLIRVAQFVIGGGESTCICPAYGGFQVSLRQLHLCPHCCHVSHETRDKVTLACVDENEECLELGRAKAVAVRADPV